MKQYLGLDVGTSSAKAVLVSENGAVIASAITSYGISIRAEEWREEDPSTLWSAATAVIREVALGRQVDAIGITGQMHGLVAIDRKGKVVRPAIIWADQRSEREVKELSAYAEAMKNQPATGFLFPSLLWVKRHEEENYRRIWKVMLPKDYIRYCLTGLVGTDTSDATGTFAYDAEKNTWSEDLLTLFGVEKGLLPEIHSSLETAGGVSYEVSRIIGVKEGTPVIYGGGDCPMQLLGSGLIKEGDLSVNIGTASQVCRLGRMPSSAVSGQNNFRHVVDGLWITLGASLNGGIALKWVKETVGLEKSSYEDIDRMANLIPAGSDGVVFLPFLNGERSPYLDSRSKGVFFGLGLGTGKAHMLRAAMEAVAYSLKVSLSLIEGVDPVRPLYAAGGGARSPLWLQIVSDVLEREVIPVKEVEASFGAAIAAAVGCGGYVSLEEAVTQMVHIGDKRYYPRKENQKVYRERVALFKKLYEANAPLWNAD